MAEDSDWRHDKAFDFVDHLDPADLAWEFLRRNRKYQDDYEKIPNEKRETANDPLTELWGLRFPGFPDPSRHRCEHLFRPAYRSWAFDPDGATAGHFIR